MTGMFFLALHLFHCNAVTGKLQDDEWLVGDRDTCKIWEEFLR